MLRRRHTCEFVRRCFPVCNGEVKVVDRFAVLVQSANNDKCLLRLRVLPFCDGQHATHSHMNHQRTLFAVANIYTHPMAQGGSGNGHYGGKAEVYMDVGEAMGKAMVELLKGTK